MNGREMAFTSVGLVVRAGQAVQHAFESLVARGEAVRPDDGTLAGTVDRVVTRDLPSALGHALGTAVDGTVRGLETARELASGLSRGLECATTALLGFAGIPSARELADLRARLERIGVELDTLNGRIQVPPWEEADTEAPAH